MLTCCTGKLRITEMFFEVPKDHSNPAAGLLKVFARSVIKHEVGAVTLSDKELKEKSQKPWLVYLQGGPGFGCRPPQQMSLTKLILDRGYQMLYLDQRGTGLSTPITAATLAKQGSAQAQADYLKLFRADSIVKDLEMIRQALTEDYPDEKKKWSLFGQSFGGFCSFTYLSFAPHGLREVFTSGGVPPINASAEQVYQATYDTVIRRNQAYYRKFPADIKVVRTLADHIGSQKGVKLPSGVTLTVSRFLSIGINFGGAEGIDAVHYMLDQMAADLENFGFFTRPTLSAFEDMTSFDTAVIYSILHEPIYCSGKNQPSNWAAQRIGQARPEFKWLSGEDLPSKDSSEALYFSGEMVYPSTFSSHSELVSLREVADILATYNKWPALYDEDQLAKNEIPVYSATFVDDMYVDFGLVNQTISKVSNVKMFVTNMMYHGAVRNNTEELVKNLFALKEDTLD